MCPLWCKSSCELQGMYGTQGSTNENTPTSLFENMHSSYTNRTITMHSTRSYICSNKQNSYAPTNIIEQEPHTNQSRQQTTDIQELKNMMKSLFEQIGTISLSLSFSVFVRLSMFKTLYSVLNTCHFKIFKITS
jgi:hypothetical protein